ncbi:MAG: GIY-YIG nuclease family protein [Alphaproteobacteria bacterium]|nr:GIY-YIG nuclease family protein [Alphaproteobacteria bacterium]
MHQHFVYMMANWNNSVLYIGVTNNLQRRDWEHKLKLIAGFTEKYNATKLVYFEETDNVHAAIAREKQLKKWRREKKNVLVNQMNPKWIDLSENKRSLDYARDDIMHYHSDRSANKIQASSLLLGHTLDDSK